MEKIGFFNFFNRLQAFEAASGITALQHLFSPLGYGQAVDGIWVTYDNIGQDSTRLPEQGRCYEGSGTAYIAITGLLTTDTIEVPAYSDTPTCTINGRLDIANGDKVGAITIKRAGIEWAFYKCDEQDGTDNFDSSGNGNDGIITDAVLANFHAIDDSFYSYLNWVGFTLVGSVYVPRDESDITKDVQGNTLGFSGEVARNGKILGSNCVQLDGIDDCIDFGTDFGLSDGSTFEFSGEIITDSDVTTAQYVLSDYNPAASKGNQIRIVADLLQFGIVLNGTNYKYVSVSILANTYYSISGSVTAAGVITGVITITANGVSSSTPSSSAGDIVTSRFSGLDWKLGASGTGTVNAKLIASNFIINDTSIYKLSEGGGGTVYDSSLNSNHGTILNAILINFWANDTTGLLRSSNILDGCQVYKDDLTGSKTILVPYNNDESKIDPTISGYTKISDNDPGVWHNDSENYLLNYKTPEHIENDPNNFAFDAAEEPNKIYYADILAAIGMNITANIATANQKKDLITYKLTDITGVCLTNLLAQHDFVNKTAFIVPDLLGDRTGTILPGRNYKYDAVASTSIPSADLNFSGRSDLVVEFDCYRTSNRIEAFIQQRTSTSNRFHIRTDSSNRVYVSFDSTIAFMSTQTFTTGYYFVRVEYDGSGATDADRLKVYLNGALQTMSVSNAPIPASTQFGNLKIKTLDNNVLNYYRMNEGDQQYLVDSIGGAHGTTINADFNDFHNISTNIMFKNTYNDDGYCEVDGYTAQFPIDSDGNEILPSTVIGTVTKFIGRVKRDLAIGFVEDILSSESFETAAVPAGWSEAFIVGGNAWLNTAGGSNGNPPGAYAGSWNTRLNGSTKGNITELIMPTPLNISTLSNPRLTFAHTQAVWSGDQDTLSVWYRESSSDSWIKLAEYLGDIPDWTVESIDLPNPTAAYEIKFQGTIDFGYGVCIDLVRIVGDSTTENYEFPDVPEFQVMNKLDTNIWNNTFIGTSELNKFKWTEAELLIIRGYLQSGYKYQVLANEASPLEKLLTYSLSLTAHSDCLINSLLYLDNIEKLQTSTGEDIQAKIDGQLYVYKVEL